MHIILNFTVLVQDVVLVLTSIFLQACSPVHYADAVDAKRKTRRPDLTALPMTIIPLTRFSLLGRPAKFEVSVFSSS